jgi:hypothetical protein
MEERRKIIDRRVNSPTKDLPFYRVRNIIDRRKNNRSTAKKHWMDYDIGLITRCLTDNLAS